MHRELETNFKKIKAQIKDIANSCRRNPNSIQLIAVSKGQPSSLIKVLYNLGHRDFGENYLQELSEKASGLSLEQIRWHYIGHIQSRKIKKIVELCNEIHTVENLKQAKLIATAAKSLSKTPFPIYISVNISQNPNKSGCNLLEAPLIAKEIKASKELKFKGFMAIPSKLTEPMGKVENEFHAMRHLQDTHENCGLSLGMSQDISLAIKAGSTAVRIGTALFGERENKH